MKKFGTPIGAAPGCAGERVGLAGGGAPLPARPGPFVRPSLWAWRFSSETFFPPLRLPALNFWLRVGRPVVGAWPEPPWLRFGAPGFSLPLGVGVAEGF